MESSLKIKLETTVETIKFKDGKEITYLKHESNGFYLPPTQIIPKQK